FAFPSVARSRSTTYPANRGERAIARPSGAAGVVEEIGDRPLSTGWSRERGSRSTVSGGRGRTAGRQEGRTNAEGVGGAHQSRVDGRSSPGIDGRRVRPGTGNRACEPRTVPT